MKAAKRTLGPDMRLPPSATAGRPILPRLEMPAPDVYPYSSLPATDGASAATEGLKNMHVHESSEQVD